VRLILLTALAAMAGGCTTQEVVVAHSVPLVTPQAPYPEAGLLDVGVIVFDSGVPDGEISEEVMEDLMRNDIFVQIRRAESMLLAVELRETLENSGHWGLVRVTPSETVAVDLLVTAEILQSDGYVLDLHVVAQDATGREWLDAKYDMETAAGAYNPQIYPNIDPYQDVLNEIANDLARARAEYSQQEVERIHEVAELRYAAELSPEAFGGYLEERGGVYEPLRLPASDDPLMQRARSVRQREQLLFDTIDQYYQSFTLDAGQSYLGWRESAREDSIRMAEAARSAKLRTGLGALAIALSIAYGQNSDRGNIADAMVRDAGIYIGGDILRSASTRRQERRLYTQLLQELSASFDNAMKPLVVEIQGTQHRLVGTAEVQFERFRELMREYYISETGFVPDDITIYVESDPEPELETTPAEPAASPAAGAESQESASDTSDADGGSPADA
jgi:hypothetical protein